MTLTQLEQDVEEIGITYGPRSPSFLILTTGSLAFIFWRVGKHGRNGGDPTSYEFLARYPSRLTLVRYF